MSEFGSLPTTLRLQLAAIGQVHDHFAGAVDDVVVGQHVAIGGDDEAAAEARCRRAAAAAGMPGAAGLAEEAPEEFRHVFLAGLRSPRRRRAELARCGRRAHRPGLDVDHGGTGLFDQPGEIGKVDQRRASCGGAHRLRDARPACRARRGAGSVHLRRRSGRPGATVENSDGDAGRVFMALVMWSFGGWGSRLADRPRFDAGSRESSTPPMVPRDCRGTALRRRADVAGEVARPLPPAPCRSPRRGDRRCHSECTLTAPRRIADSPRRLGRRPARCRPTRWPGRRCRAAAPSRRAGAPARKLESAAAASRTRQPGSACYAVAQASARAAGPAAVDGRRSDAPGSACRFAVR